MRSVVELDTDFSEDLLKVLQNSFEGNKKVDYNLETRKGKIRIETVTETQSQLRGCTDTVFRLSSLSQKVFQKY